jgi:crotonobetainyl-CoA:carnitine CoA-transferase CaiB-like acyl-CoA transferase
MSDGANDQPVTGFLGGVRVIELGGELCEYTGKVLAGLGAEVFKVEPPNGERTRTYGPFYHDELGPNNSLYFWHFNLGKKSVVLDPENPQNDAILDSLIRRADIVLVGQAAADASDTAVLYNVSYERVKNINSTAIYVDISSFGRSGPWSSYAASDLIHLALGGVVMNCGYDPHPSGHYETEPVAPQMWLAYQITGDMILPGILAALRYSRMTGIGQMITTSVHECVSKQTETDVPDWIFQRSPHHRHTCRHSRVTSRMGGQQGIAMTKDGRWIFPYQTYMTNDQGARRDRGENFRNMVNIFRKDSLQDDLDDEKYQDPEFRALPHVDRHISDVKARYISSFLFSEDIWRLPQEVGITWAPLRRPEENLEDEHWSLRETFLEIEHPETGERFWEVGAKWLCAEVPWSRGGRAPMLGEHTSEAAAWRDLPTGPVSSTVSRPRKSHGKRSSRNGKPFALDDIRIVDLTWLLASGGAGRFLTALGAEVIKVEHKSHHDAMRWAGAMAPPGGRAERAAAAGPLEVPRNVNPNRNGSFMDVNAGKLSISLNLKTTDGRALLARLIEQSNAVAEGFTPGTMNRLGFGYERLSQLRPGIVYAQQSGFGQVGVYGRYRSYGPIAQAVSGMSEMSGLPEPFPPAGIGYSFLDWEGAYNLALALSAGLYRQSVTGEGCWIDSSQAEAGIYMTGTAILDYFVNGRRWSRYGNRSPYKRASPHGIYRAQGDDSWIAIACFNEDQWLGLLDVLNFPALASQPEALTLGSRIDNSGLVDKAIGEKIACWDAYELMYELQAAGVPAGVCQNAQQRIEVDPQLKHIGWLMELPQSEIGTWPVKTYPAVLSETPAYTGGLLARSGPSYGEDNEYVYGKILGLSSNKIRDLVERDVI